jgi:hypothetical protein
VAAFVAAALLSTSVSSFEASGSPPQAAADPKVIRDWNAVAFDTIIVDAGKMNAEAFIWLGVRAGCRLQRRCRHHPALRPLQLERSWPPGGVTSGRRRGSRARRPARVLPGVTGPTGDGPGGITRRDSRRSGEGPGHPLRRARGRPAHRVACGRRPFRAGHIRRPAGARGLASDPARVRPVLRPVDGADAAASARVTQPVPSGSAARVDLPDIHGGFQRGEGGGFGNEHGPDRPTPRGSSLGASSRSSAHRCVTWPPDTTWTSATAHACSRRLT